MPKPKIETLGDLADEVYAATAYIMEYGAIELGTPQSKRLIEAMQKLYVFTDRKPKLPAGYPMQPNEPINRTEHQTE